MPPISESPARTPDLDPRACLERTRSAVLNVLVTIGVMIALSGAVLRAWPVSPLPVGSQAAYRQLTILLVALGAASYASRHILDRKTARAEPSRKNAIFYWAHVAPAVLAALAVPLGLYCGSFVDPRLGAVCPFWVMPLALGLLALPRARELEALGSSPPSVGASQR
jgi:hypothetical protein